MKLDIVNCESCLYRDIPRKIGAGEQNCSCGKLYPDNGAVYANACPNVCKHEVPARMKRDYPLNIALAKLTEEFEYLDKCYVTVKDLARIDEFEKWASTSQVIVNTSFSTLYKLIVRDESYGNIHTLNSHPTRQKGKDLELRKAWDSYLFGNCGRHIRFGSLCVIPTETEEKNFLGLSAYGECCMVLKESKIKERASAFVENSKNFYNKYSKLHRYPPCGYRSTWENRAKLAVIKHAHDVQHTTTQVDFFNILLGDRNNKDSEEFIEIHIWDSFNWEWVECVLIEKNIAQDKFINKKIPDIQLAGQQKARMATSLIEHSKIADDFGEQFGKLQEFLATKEIKYSIYAR